MNNKLTTAERRHIGKVKELACSICDAPGPSSAHHINQACHYTVVALCRSCHQDELNGIHGQRIMWKIYNHTELSALNVTLKRLMENE